LLTEEALKRIAQVALSLGTGGRALAAVVRRAMEGVAWRLAELRDEGVDRLVLTPEAVEGVAEPIAVRRGEKIPAKWKHAAPAPRSRRALPDIELLRAEAVAAVAGTSAASAVAFSDVTGWSAERVRQRLESVKELIDWRETIGEAREFWLQFEGQNKHRLQLVLRVAEELLARNTTITHFYRAYKISQSENIQACLHFHDYWDLKTKEEKKRGEPGGSS
jgi:hypothetical protein